MPDGACPYLGGFCPSAMGCANYTATVTDPTLPARAVVCLPSGMGAWMRSNKTLAAGVPQHGRVPMADMKGDDRSMVYEAGTSALSAEQRRFEELQSRLTEMFESFLVPDEPRTVLIVPSLSMDREVLANISGAHHYEE